MTRWQLISWCILRVRRYPPCFSISPGIPSRPRLLCFLGS
uniref:Uncharacterized protein n=1 Tax=Anguilla anguilla TaxID=7936 RepID=A0A0E9UNL0_ANGAN